MARSRCPMDGSIIPQVAEVQIGTESVRLCWCASCGELFASLANPFREAAGFAKDGKGGWRLFRAFGSESEVQVAATAAATVNPDTVT
jgi:hypothetical protein